MSGGLTPTGFVAKTVEEVQADVNTKLLGNVNASLDLSADQPLGQIVGAFSEEMAEVWELMATVYGQMDPDVAEGSLLDGVSAISGTRRRSATYSVVSCDLNINATTTVPAGSVAYVSGQPQNRWVLQADVVNGTGGVLTLPGDFKAENAGPVVANSGTLTQIATPVSGWNSLTNPGDATLGIPQDSDPVLRLRREAELSAAGSGGVDKIRADVLEVNGVIQAFVYENTTLITDADGLPGKSFRVVVWDGPGASASNTLLAQAIWNSKPAGIQTYGAQFGTATDSLGNPQTVFFDRAVQVPIYFTLTTTRDSSAPSNYRTLVKAALAAYAVAKLNLGVDVIDVAFRAQPLSVLGVDDVPTFFLDVTPAPAATSNIVISGLQIATVDTANMLVDGS